MDDETTVDEQEYSSSDEVGRDHIPMVNLRQSWWKPLIEDRPATPEPAWIIPSSDLKEYVIAERDFKYMYTSDFEDMYLLNL
ncbi:hypothetical protein Tco_0443279, partial [Tanacetum coccineum]